MRSPRTLLFALALSAFALLPSSAHARLKVVATLPSLAAIAKEVGGSAVEVEALVASTEDPHYVDPRPSLIVKLNQADLLVVNGLDLEVGWLPKMQVAARNARIQTGGQGFFDASRHVEVIDVPQGKVDRSQGDVHPGGNPHYLLDPRAGAKVALALGERMAALDGANAEAYRRGARELAEELEALAREVRAQFEKVPPEARRVVTYHASLGYLVRWLGLEEVATLEPKPGIPPDPGHVARVLQVMRGKGVKTILQEEFYPRSTSKTLAGLTGARVVALPGGARFPEGETYPAHLRRIVEDVQHALAPH